MKIFLSSLNFLAVFIQLKMELNVHAINFEFNNFLEQQKNLSKYLFEN